ncbi:MAG: 4-hydroxythreonine-4-phosphate dehydrogenase (EC [uncultured Campylobacterales bacterium]|uniref:4-hydroxythreonine-4-phosphate dehydrogenase n=1 Tax=uncultured Campylobacterales bacterium TaxID=352960 RepID=A0A6S6T698_9BACT|nr:MAG: 4-hydroxythreonine-4-phosphate dehydrogenase (EC [uncultured Campylobacterales bacterium]
MQNNPKIAISIGDLNGIGMQIALECHEHIKTICEPIYMIDTCMASQSAKLLKLELPDDFECEEYVEAKFTIEPGTATKESGLYSYSSFLSAVNLAKHKKVKGIVTLPINKEAWKKAGIRHKGHTDALDTIFNTKAIMMLGCQKLFVLLYTHHIPLSEVSSTIKLDSLYQFLLTTHTSADSISVLGLNPHAGDNGVIGHEDSIILQAINKANKTLNKQIFKGPLVPDTAFVGNHPKHIIAMYHDQGLIPLKALYFEDSINVSLNIPILRSSVDHGTAYDKAYKNQILSTKSYINAIKYIKNIVNSI